MKILVAEDNAVSRKLLESRLTKWNFEMISVENGKDAWEILQADDSPGIAILDWMMPGMTGIEVCRKVREQAKEPYIYILLLTARDEKQDLVEAIESGADDYIAKPFDQNELRARLRAGKRMIELHEELISTRETLRLQATHDALTGLWNRSAILDILEKELARAQRQKNTLAILLVDIDHFKRVNDNYGHIAGDTVLGETAKKMLSSLRPYDSAGRYGGEEFLIVVPDCSEQDALSVAERMRSGIQDNSVNIRDGVVPVTISIGVTATNPSALNDPIALIKSADTALYEAKANGRNRVELAG